MLDLVRAWLWLLTNRSKGMVLVVVEESKAGLRHACLLVSITDRYRVGRSQSTAIPTALVTHTDSPAIFSARPVRYPITLYLISLVSSCGFKLQALLFCLALLQTATSSHHSYHGQLTSCLMYLLPRMIQTVTMRA
jgi:hypothetical protein